MPEPEKAPRKFAAMVKAFRRMKCIKPELTDSIACVGIADGIRYKAVVASGVARLRFFKAPAAR